VLNIYARSATASVQNLWSWFTYMFYQVDNLCQLALQLSTTRRNSAMTSSIMIRFEGLNHCMLSVNGEINHLIMIMDGAIDHSNYELAWWAQSLYLDREWRNLSLNLIKHDHEGWAMYHFNIHLLGNLVSLDIAHFIKPYRDLMHL